MSQPASLEKLEQIKQATLSDRPLNYTINDWPKYAEDVQEQIRQYYTARGDNHLLQLNCYTFSSMIRSLGPYP